MKKIVLVVAVISFFMVTNSTTYGQEPDKKSVEARENLKDAKKDLIDAKQELKEAQLDSISDYQQFKKESEERISSYEKNIADLRVKIAKEKKENKADKEKLLAALDQKNIALKKELDKFNDKGKDKWKSFVKEFNHNMDELGKALKDLTTDNKK